MERRPEQGSATSIANEPSGAASIVPVRTMSEPSPLRMAHAALVAKSRRWTVMTSKNVASGVQKRRKAAGKRTRRAAARPKNAHVSVMRSPTTATISKRT